MDDLKIFKYAFNGLRLAVQERNMSWHILVALIVLVMSMVCMISPLEWAIVFLTISMVLISEAFNTVVEKTCDLIEPNYSEKIGELKDISAGLVLISAIAALLVGVVVFGPYLIKTWFYSWGACLTCISKETKQ